FTVCERGCCSNVGNKLDRSLLEQNSNNKNEQRKSRRTDVGSQACGRSKIRFSEYFSNEKNIHERLYLLKKFWTADAITIPVRLQ
ncbi:unnamed protein product, partial [Heterotrigona itama]